MLRRVIYSIMRPILLALLLFASALCAREPVPNYTYACILDRVIDGDTVEVDVDLGFGIWVHDVRLRLENVYAPEIRGEEKSVGMKWKARLEALLGKKTLVVQTIRKGSKEVKTFDRYVAQLWADGLNVNKAMMEK